MTPSTLMSCLNNNALAKIIKLLLNPTNHVTENSHGIFFLSLFVTSYIAHAIIQLPDAIIFVKYVRSYYRHGAAEACIWIGISTGNFNNHDIMLLLYHLMRGGCFIIAVSSTMCTQLFETPAINYFETVLARVAIKPFNVILA